MLEITSLFKQDIYLLQIKHSDMIKLFMYVGHVTIYENIL